MKDNLQAKSVINCLANELKLNEVKELLFCEKSIWMEGQQPSVFQLITRAGHIAMQVHRLEELRACMKGDASAKKPKWGARKKRATEESDVGSGKQPEPGAKTKNQANGPRKDGNWPQYCMNKKCNERHKI